MSNTARTSVEVFLDAAELGPPQKIGTLYRHDSRITTAPSFEYTTQWLQNEQAFTLDPYLASWQGEQHPPDDRSMFGIFSDSAPDRWGRVLMERREAAQAIKEQRKLRQLYEMDFLLGVHDLTRAGALRFRTHENEPFVDNSSSSVPPCTSLQELARISRCIEAPDSENLPEYEQWLALLIAPGSSLGGARPKANFTDETQELCIAKFPAHNDRYDVGAWEFVTHCLARKTGITVPRSSIETLTETYHTFTVARFDRRDRGSKNRRMFASAMTLLGRQDGENDGSYLDLAQFVSDHGASGHIDEDLAQLFRRIVFNVLVGNRDDHLRNHGFIRESSGWRLAPAYDMNPNPSKGEHALSLDGVTHVPNIDAVVATADLYRLKTSEATDIVTQTRNVVSSWGDEAKLLGLSTSEILRMRDAFLSV